MLTPGPHICMTMGLHACQYCTCMHIQSATQYSTQHCMNGEADDSRFVSMHAYMHLAFKELKLLSNAHWWLRIGINRIMSIENDI